MFGAAVGTAVLMSCAYIRLQHARIDYCPIVEGREPTWYETAASPDMQSLYCVAIAGVTGATMAGYNVYKMYKMCIYTMGADSA